MDCDEEELKATKNREKTADELFKELGYRKTENPLDFWGEECNGVTYYNTETFNEIFFNKDKKSFCKYYDSEKILFSSEITFEELQAINKKVEELGWK